MDPQMALMAILLARTVLEEIPQGIKMIKDIMVAWDKVDPTAEDFDALAALIESKRPKDPLKK